MVENNISPNDPPAPPLLYEVSFEQLEKDEEETDAALTETMLGISETTFKDSGRGLRSVHAKSHGLLTGSLRVLDDMPPVLAQGIAGSPRTYPVVIRLSTTPGDILDDSVSTPRAMALKIIGVEGPRLSESEGGATQDFVLANGPAFTSATAKKFLGGNGYPIELGIMVLHPFELRQDRIEVFRIKVAIIDLMAARPQSRDNLAM